MDEDDKIVNRLKGIELPHLTYHQPSLERIRDAHSYMAASSFKNDACNAGHTTYAQQGSEACYLCVLAALLDKAEKENVRLKEKLKNLGADDL